MLPPVPAKVACIIASPNIWVTAIAPGRPPSPGMKQRAPRGGARSKSRQQRLVARASVVGHLVLMLPVMWSGESSRAATSRGNSHPARLWLRGDHRPLASVRWPTHGRLAASAAGTSAEPGAAEVVDVVVEADLGPREPGARATAVRRTLGPVATGASCQCIRKEAKHPRRRGPLRARLPAGRPDAARRTGAARRGRSYRRGELRGGRRSGPARRRPAPWRWRPCRRPACAPSAPAEARNSGCATSAAQGRP